MANIRERLDRDGNLVGYQVRIVRKGFPNQIKTFRTRGQAVIWATHIESQIFARRDALQIAEEVGARGDIHYLNDLDRDAIMTAVSLLSPIHGHGGRDAGSVYIALSPSLGWRQVKIGKTSRDIDQRMKALSSHTGVPSPFAAVYHREFARVSLAEHVMHEIFSSRRSNALREFFDVPVQYSIEALDVLHDVLQH